VKELRFYYDNLSEPNCMPNDKGLTFGNYGFIITRATGIKNFEKCEKEFKITFTNDRSKKYFYVVEPQGMYTKVIESLTTLINKDVLEDMKNDKAILCISFIQEGDYHKDFYKDINKFCDDTSISINNIVFLTNNPKIKKTENIFNVNYYLNHMTVTYQNNPNRYNSIKNLNFENIRPYHFLSFNRNPKLHRQVLGSLLLKNNLLDKGMISMGYNVEGIHKFEHYMPTEYNWRTPIYSEEKIKELDLHRYMNELKSMCPLLIEDDTTEEEIKDDHTLGWINIRPETYNKAYFSIIAGNSFDTPWIHPDEKFWKPFGQFHPFIWVGPTGGLQHLKEMGFKSFSPYIDESYDTEEDCEKRMLMIVNEITRLCSMPKEEIHNWYYNMQDILIYNWKRIAENDINPFYDTYNKLFNLVN
jgi:hypothetical protein